AAVAAVANGMAAATTATTVAAGAFVGAAYAYGAAALFAASTSSSVQDFSNQGDWNTVASTVGGAVFGGGSAYLAGRSTSSGSQKRPSNAKSTTINNDILDLQRSGSALKTDPYHAFPNVVDNYAGYATKTPVNNGMLYQISGSLNGQDGRFEWIVQAQQVTHRMFIPGGGMSGIPILK
ncbi:MAG: hypothetical protein PT951_00620, partial [Eubacteriales bacterium]|nr:hypothetical protein [Eubacteriales bacterium]